MNILSICNSPDALKIIRIVVLFINIIKIAVPIILIVFLSIKIMGAVAAQNQEEINKRIRSSIPNIIAAVLIFLVPTFIDIVARLSMPNSDYAKCISGISKEKIEIAYDEKMSSLLSSAEASERYSDYSAAYSYLRNIKDETKRSYYESRLEELKEKIDKKNEEKPDPSRPEPTHYYEPILPNSGEKIFRSETSDSLIVNITKGDDYYLTRIWAIDPYNQLNKRNAEPYGSKLTRPGEILSKEISEKSMGSKLVVGFNASGFYLKDTYDASSVKYYPKYDRTSVGTIVITDGQVIRNNYEKGDLLTWFIAGVDRNNKLVVFDDIKMKQTNVAEKKSWSEGVINSGIRNTLTFAAPLILNGQKTNYNNKNSHMPGTNDSKKGLQLLCQINDNNFVLFTANTSTRNKGTALFLNLGCQTAVNLDGGDSVALLYKSRTSSSIETIMGNGRSLPEVAYFSEK